jgi:hypothetical protein
MFSSTLYKIKLLKDITINDQIYKNETLLIAKPSKSIASYSKKSKGLTFVITIKNHDYKKFFKFDEFEIVADYTIQLSN